MAHPVEEFYAWESFAFTGKLRLAYRGESGSDDLSNQLDDGRQLPHIVPNLSPRQ